MTLIVVLRKTTIDNSIMSNAQLYTCHSKVHLRGLQDTPGRPSLACVHAAAPAVQARRKRSCRWTAASQSRRCGRSRPCSRQTSLQPGTRRPRDCQRRRPCSMRRGSRVKTHCTGQTATISPARYDLWSCLWLSACPRHYNAYQRARQLQGDGGEESATDVALDADGGPPSSWRQLRRLAVRHGGKGRQRLETRPAVQSRRRRVQTDGVSVVIE